MIVCVCNIFDRAKDLLPHYLMHYDSMGVEKFFFGIYGPENNPLWDQVKEFGAGLDISIERIPYEEGFNVDLDGKFKERISLSLGKGWIVPTDLDELHVPPDDMNFSDLALACDIEGADYVWSSTRDRITLDGTIPPVIDPSMSIWNQFPLITRLTTTLVQGYDRKLCMVKAGTRIYGGHHSVDNGYKKYSKPATTYHFKWWGQLQAREQKKLEIYTKIGFEWKSENERLLAYLKTHDKLPTKIASD